MSDEFDLDKLTSAMKGATPTPDAAKRDAQYRACRGEFEKLHATRQESATDTRPNPETAQKTGLISGVREMFSRLTTRGVLAATTSVATLGVAMIVVLPNIQNNDPAARWLCRKHNSGWSRSRIRTGGSHGDRRSRDGG